MNKILLLLLVVFLCGCGTAKASIPAGTNGLGELGSSSGSWLRNYITLN